MATNGDESIARDTARLTINNEQPSEHTQSVPRIRSPGVTATDITDRFARASSVLTTGQLVKDDFFTLFEAVAALEIMDPKMDNGYLGPGETLEDDYDVARPLLPEETIGIMDQLLCHEIAWHQGSPLSQTLFTSLYIDKLLISTPKALKDIQFFSSQSSQTLRKVDRPSKLLDVVLRTYCVALVKCCDFVHRRIEAEHCYEEEDFVTHLYNRSLLSEIAPNELCDLLDKAMWWLEKEEARTISGQLRTALAARLQFRKAFLGAVSKDVCIIQDPSTAEWEECANLLHSIEESHNLGLPVEESFSIKIQRKLASTVPPRPMVNITFEKALTHLKRLCQDGKDLALVLSYCGSNNVLNFLWTFQAKKPQPSVYIRALLQSLICNEDTVLGKISVKQLLYCDLAELVLPADILLDPRNWEVEHPRDRRFQIRKKMDEFAARAGQSYIDIFRAICQNRSRIRRTLCHTLRDWENLQMDAEELDNELRPFTGEEAVLDPSFSPEPMFAFPLSSWAYHHKLRQMEWVIQLGFELQIYQPDELLGMYWYLQHIVQIHIRHVERMRGFVTRKLVALPSSTENATFTKEEIVKTLSFLNYTLLDATATQTFADSMVYLYSSLYRLNLVVTPQRPYSTNALRYELRMKPFLNIGLPELVRFEEFQNALDQPNDTVFSILSAAADCIIELRKDYELVKKMDSSTTRTVLCEGWWKNNLKDTLRASIATSIAIATLIKALKVTGQQNSRSVSLQGVKAILDDQLTPEGQQGYHPFWVVPKIVDTVR